VQGGAPVAAVALVEHRQVDTGADRVGDGVEDLVLVAEVVVERGAADAQLGGEAAGGDRVEPFRVHERARRLDDAVSAEKGLARSGHAAHSRPGPGN
jgi:hypothetical protein